MSYAEWFGLYLVTGTFLMTVTVDRKVITGIAKDMGFTKFETVPNWVIITAGFIVILLWVIPAIMGIWGSIRGK